MNGRDSGKSWPFPFLDGTVASTSEWHREIAGARSSDGDDGSTPHHPSPDPPIAKGEGRMGTD